MQINSIKLENFRQYYGSQSVIFAVGDKNVTIIFGENGKGKTGIFRALMFGLFGSTHLQQDNKNDRIHLVNFNKLEESNGRPVKSIIEIDFQHKGKKYIINREIIGYKRGDEIEERICPPRLNLIDENGNFSPEPIQDETIIKEIINEIIDEKIKDFFLFDAERIDTLAKTDVHVKEEVKTVITKLLQIDKLDDAIVILKSLQNRQKRSLTEKTSNIDLKHAEEAIDKLEDEILKKQEIISLKENNILACNNEIEEIEEKLSENQGIRVLQQEIKSVQDKINEKYISLKYIKETLQVTSFNKLHMLLMKDHYLFTKDYLNQILTDQKDIIPYEVIEKSLTDMICSCCKTKLNEVKSALDEVLALRDNYKRSELTPLITELNGTIVEFNGEKDGQLKFIKEKLIEIKDFKDIIDSLQSKINGYGNEIQAWSKKEENLNNLELSMQRKEENRRNLKEEIKQIDITIGILEKELSKAQREYEDLKNKDESLKYDNKKIEYITTLKDSLEKIFEEYSVEMRDKLMRETTNIFKVLIDSKDKSLIKEIKINDKYELELYNWNGTKITQDISQGQRQIVALAFITALAKVAAGGTENIDFPLFMDTPFGRVSGNNRDNLIENIPLLTSQWILLLTDTEFTASEEIKMKEVDKLGRWYKLDKIKDGHTNIVPMNLNETMATRR
ncbi:chromosome segregation protein [Clostridium saccharobutylicum]|uniref:hypothetical protein n=1 Tax=Clostridium saccharobutylicum TaxID=169679 RepID=UPI000983EBD5|nr:hypothetical protein [Clostridium saccharobutylicum]AQS09898.1 chromosome segregation protein [Clostridium saccharobutylicum]MBC2437052.1 hypothetical protein [Clostridium saccharobutylicum]NSB89506.1 DNA sulfur modification protein DndD [Clostridium saccharobutylicum]NYC27696.1 DNA sulfur modification protein DndD [Clostridium saccharobutylicum]OOM12777.1 chromosome segregation protein [Clostridium saccharobutylicum]